MDAASLFLTSCFYVRIYHANFIQSKNISNPPYLNATWKTAKSIKQSHNKHLQQTFAADLLLKR